MNNLDEIYSWIKTTWHIELFNLGKSPFTVQTLVLLLLSLFLLFYLSGLIRKLLIKKIFPSYHLDVGVGQSVATIVRYFLIIVGLVVIFQTTGIDLSALGLLVGALGVGIGFGLQGITNNFISGLIILFERPVKVGDKVEIGDLTGNISDISARATIITTNDNISVIVPNSDLINKQVINWSHNSSQIRLNFPVNVSYKEDPEKVREVLLGIVKGYPGVLETPEPYVRFTEFGENSLNFLLQIWTVDFIHNPAVLKSEIYFAIFKKFKEEDIVLPFTQRDIHIKSGLEILGK